MRIRLSLLLALATLVASSAVAPPSAACGAAPTMPALTFESPTLVDHVRAGGEPSVFGMPDGTLLYASHASTTLLYKPNVADPAYALPYNNSIYLWRSEDAGTTWRYVGLGGTEVGPHALTGFSDPTIAVDKAGNAYVAGITLANLYVAKSADSGKTWIGQPIAAAAADREWLAADEPNVVYMNANSLISGRMLWKSSDGGLTWNWASGIDLPGGGPPSPIAVDQSDGRLYFPTGGGVAVYPNARANNYSHFIAYPPNGLPADHGFLNPIALDGAGNVYVAWNTSNTVGVAYSTDRGQSWRSTTIASGSQRVQWPWVSAGSDGRAGVSWLQRDSAGAWRVRAAVSVTAHGWLDGCNALQPPVWQTATATPDPVHVGQICEQGTFCNANFSADRRLGDYITNSITADGRFVLAYANTTAVPSSSVSRSGFARQATGPNLNG